MNPSFYGAIQAYSYDVGDNPREIIGFYLNLWKDVGRPQPILEPMCGTGLNLISFLQAGAVGDGVDNSPYMLARCRTHLEANGLEASLYEADVETMQLPVQYRFIVIPGRSLGMVETLERTARALQALYTHLLPGGWLAFDVWTPHHLETMGQHGQIHHGLQDFPDGSAIWSSGVWQHLDDGHVVRLWVKHELFRQQVLENTEVFDYRERLFDQDVMEDLVRRAGFGNISLYRAYDRSAPLEPEDNFVVVCQRPTGTASLD